MNIGSPSGFGFGSGSAAHQLPKTVKCPTCGGQSVFAHENPFRPFCSPRCQNMDFGAWAAESFVVRVPQESSEQIDDLYSGV